MEGELQELRDLVAQLRADNERLWQEQAAAVPGPSTVPSTMAPSTASAPLTERLVLEIENVPCLGEEQV